YRRLAESVTASWPAGSFVGLICGDEVSAGKPDAEPYLKGAGLLGLDPADCVALEDSKPGLASAEAAGTIAVGVPHFVDLEPRPGRILWPSLEGRESRICAGCAPSSRLRSPRSAQSPRAAQAPTIFVISGVGGAAFPQAGHSGLKVHQLHSGDFFGRHRSDSAAAMMSFQIASISNSVCSISVIVGWDFTTLREPRYISCRVWTSSPESR